MQVVIPEAMECLDGMVLSLTADVVETDDHTEDESEWSLPIKVFPTPVVHQALLSKAFDGGHRADLSQVLSVG
jgi:hypothetical protein